MARMCVCVQCELHPFPSSNLPPPPPPPPPPASPYSHPVSPIEPVANFTAAATSLGVGSTMDYSVAVAGLLPGSTYVKTLERDIGFITLDLC